MSRLDELYELDNPTPLEKACRMYKREDAAAELAALRAENKALRELIEDLNRMNRMARDEGCPYLWGYIYQERIDELLGLPFTEPSEAEARG